VDKLTRDSVYLRILCRRVMFYTLGLMCLSINVVDVFID